MKPYEVNSSKSFFNRKLKVYEDMVEQCRRVIKTRHIINHPPLLAELHNSGIRASKGDTILFLDNNVILYCNIMKETYKNVCER